MRSFTPGIWMLVLGYMLSQFYRAFLTVLTQKLMRTSAMLNELKNRILLEGVVAAVSTAGLLGMAGFLWLFPTALGQNVAVAAPLLILVVLVLVCTFPILATGLPGLMLQ